MAHFDKEREFYQVFMHESTEGIWLAGLNPPLSLHVPEHEQLDHLFRYAFIRECNQVFAQMYGFESSADLIGTTLLGFISREDKGNLATLVAFLRSGCRLRNAETHEVDREGNPRWFLNNTIGIVEGDNLLRVWGAQREITDGKKRAMELRDLKEKLPPQQKAILQLIADGHTMKEVAGALSISEKTAFTHRSRLMQRLNLHDVPALVHFITRLGIAHAEHSSGHDPFL